jgi:hypothetical protein
MPNGNTLKIVESCASAATCSATVAYAYVITPPPPPPPPPSPSPPPPQIFRTATCSSFSQGFWDYGSNALKNNYRNFASCQIKVPPSPLGSVLTFGTTNVQGAQCSGNTYLALVSPSGNTLVVADDYGKSQCSYATLALPPAPNGAVYTIQEGCYQNYKQCSGVAAWTLTLTMPSLSPPPPTVYTTKHVQASMQQFQNKLIGNGNNNPHVVQVPSGGSSSTSTETTANGKVTMCARRWRLRRARLRWPRNTDAPTRPTTRQVGVHHHHGRHSGEHW